MKEDRRMKLQKKKFNSNHLLAIFIVVCGLLAGISVFAGGVLTPVKNIFFTVLSPMQEALILWVMPYFHGMRMQKARRH